jgi:aminomethyltransferase
MSDETSELRTTPFTEKHHSLGAKMAAFAGYDMPIHYTKGILHEHVHCRTQAGLFDVSHMGQAYLMGPNAAKGLEAVVPGDITGLKIGQQRYTVLLNDDGGVIDDLMVLKLSEDLLFLVANASRKDADYNYLRRKLPRDVALEVLSTRALIALQGPAAEAALKPHLPEASTMGFMQGRRIGDIIVTRSGYTGEDGFELSLPTDENLELVDQLAEHMSVEWIGLGARDSLRLEAGLCLYGHELNETISPIEADLAWVVSKRRRATADFAGSAIILHELKNGTRRKRVGLKPEGRVIARDGTTVHDAAGQQIGIVTSGGFGPSVGGPIAIGLLESGHSALGTGVFLNVRGQQYPATVAALPFVPHRYKKL